MASGGLEVYSNELRQRGTGGGVGAVKSVSESLSKSKSNSSGSSGSGDTDTATPTAGKKSVYGRTPDGTGELPDLDALFFQLKYHALFSCFIQSSRFHRRIMSSLAYLTRDFQSRHWIS